MTWKTEYEVAVEALRGKRTQLGKGFWPRLDTNLNLSIGGTKVAEGNYYLGIGRAIDGAWKLVLFSPGAIRRAKGDAATTSMITSPAIEAPLSYERVGQPVQELRIELKVLPEQVGHAMLSLQWGNHQLTASVVAELPLPGAKAVDRTKTGDGEAGVEKGELAPGSPPRGRGRSGK